MRLFIALHLFPEQRRCVEATQTLLRARVPSRSVKWVAPENVHLTLQFMGEVEAARVTEIEAALCAACAQCAPFELQLGGIGCFPDARKPRVIWLGIKGDVLALRLLQSKIANNVKPFHEQRDVKPFAPHLTLARVKTFDREEARIIGCAIQNVEAPQSEAWHVETVELMQSELTPCGPVYTTLAEIQL